MAILTNSDDLVGAANLSWQQQMKRAIRRPEELAEQLELPVELICASQSKGEFPLFVPIPYLQRIEKGNPNDPLLLQVLPTSRESESHPAFSADPLGEAMCAPAAGLLHKYRSRALLVTTGACAIHCRYCFRRHFPYQASKVSNSKWQQGIEYIQADATIEEVILSGGDPLTLVDESLNELIQELSAIEHLRRLRIHTRLPVVIPQRVTRMLVEVLAESRLKTVVVVHCNHANEIDESAARSIGLLKHALEAVLNQAVLLKGVNDTLQAQIGLSEKLIDTGILPYYLHQLDPVSGAAHFEVPLEQGLALMEQLRRSLSGYMVPRFVREIPGEPYKTILA